MQAILPLIPNGATPISDTISVFSENDRCTYFCGINPIYSHDVNDINSFKLFTSTLVNEGACKKSDIVNCLGVALSSVKRSLKKLRMHGASSFFERRKVRRGTIFTRALLESVQQLLDEGATRQAVCSEYKIKISTLKKAISSGRLIEPKVLTLHGSSKSLRSSQDASFILGTACSRTDERLLAALGKINRATTRFEDCNDLSYGGVLTAIPFLEANGLFRFLSRHFALPAGYYDVIHIVLLLAFMALCRIKIAEQLRFESPGELGKLLGLDRIPEVKTLRSKIGVICNENNTKEWMLELSKFYMNNSAELSGVLYVDGHVRVYHGTQTKLPRRFVSRQRLCLRGVTDYYVNDALGQPFFVVSKTINQGMIAVLEESIIPRLLIDVPEQPDDYEFKADPYLHRFILVFDREASSRNLFKKLWANHRIACISYQKNVKDSWAEEEFSSVTVPMPNGEELTMNLAERGTYLGDKNSGLWVKETRKLMESGHQTSIIGTAYSLADIKLSAYMFSRWAQENFFGYMMKQYNIDRLVDYGTEVFPEPDHMVVNPQHRAIERQVRSLNSKLSRQRALFGAMTLEIENGSGNNLEKLFADKAELCETIDLMESELQELKLKRKKQSKHIPFKLLPQKEQFKQLAPSRKAFTDTIKMLAYRSETAMANILKDVLGKHDDARRLVCDLMRSEADLKPDNKTKTLYVYIHRMSNPQADRAIQYLLKKLNETEPLYPGTDWQIKYRIIPVPSNIKK